MNLSIAADWKVRARAPVKANTLRGASPRQAERSPACDRRLLRCGNTRWEAAGGELPVRNRADVQQRQRELDSAGRWDELVMAMRSPCRSPRLGKRIPARAGKASGTASVR